MLIKNFMNTEILKSYKNSLLKAFEIRCVENNFLELFREGLIRGTVHTCKGQELLPVLLKKYLLNNDKILSNHRGHGHFLSWTNDIEKLTLELLGKEGGVSCGYGGSQHLYCEGFLSNGIQGGLTAIAGGIASSLNKNEIVVNFIGDGTLGEGLLYESFNLTSKWNLPVLYILENNKVAQTTSINQTLSGTIQGRANAFGINFFESDARNIKSLDNILKLATKFVREKRQPVLMEINTYRMGAHSKGDDNRDDKILDEINHKDLVNVAIKENIINGDEIKTIKDNISNITKKCLKTKTLTKVKKYYPTTFSKNIAFLPLKEKSSKKLIELINNGLENVFNKYPSLLMIGEDIEDANKYFSKDYGGAFKASKELSKKFPGRVINTPISEAAIVGFSIGRALTGLPTIVEIMFGDFLTLTIDQIVQHASKIPTMFGKNIDVPMILRTPMGGRRGYGPTHSQSIERLIVGLPNINVVVMNHFVDPLMLYQKALETKKFNIIIENKVLYSQNSYKEIIEGYEYEASDLGDFPIIKIKPKRHSPSCTIFTYGHELVYVVEALKILLYEHDIFCEVICPTLITPLEIEPLKDSVIKTKRLLTIEEGPSFAAIGSEAISSIIEEGINSFNVIRLGNNSVIPCSYEAEIDLLPGTRDIIQGVLKLAK